MYGKTVSGGALAVTSGVTYAQTGSIIAAGVALLVLGTVAVVASRMRRRHDDNVIGR